ncbi:MAG TPA: carbohydrate ABC transporter permease [Deinococcales bacterium]|nr:carbohydrate ABC transporter permease [Deinococcales bacterium]
MNQVPATATPGPARRAEPTGHRRAALAGLAARHGLLIAVSVVMIVPFLWMIRTSLSNSGVVFTASLNVLPEEFHWQNYREAFTVVPFATFLLNSAKVALFVVLGQVITCTLGGYAFARLRFPGRNVLFVLVLATLMIPAQVTLVPLYIIMQKLSLINTHWALILPALASPFGTFLMRQFFVSLPDELEDAAKVDGASVPQFIRFVAFPMARPMVATLAVLAFIGSWGNLIGPLIFLNDLDKATVPLGLLQFSTTYATNWSALMAATTVSLVPSFLLYVFAQRYIINAYSMAGVSK